MPTIKRQSPTATAPSQTATVPQSDDGWALSKGVKVLVYGRSGTGKTTFWASFPGRILTLLCSGGKQPGELRSINTPENRKKIDARVIRNTDQLRGMLETADQYATVVLDHASGLQDLTLKEILGLDELPVQKSWGMAGQQQYGQSSLMVKELLRSLLSLPQNVVIVGQERTFGGGDEAGTSDIIMPTVGAALTPSVVGWLNPACDYVVQTYLRPRMVTATTKVGEKQIVTSTRGKGVEYCLRTEPHDVFTTKFRVPRGGKPLPECIVDPSYDKMMKLVQGA